MLDVVIRNGEVLDGGGEKGYIADLGVENDRISCIGSLSGVAAKETIDAGGRVVCPGFIDSHSHADLAVYRSDHVRLFEPLVRQGITTFVGGNCGFAMAPLGNNRRDAIANYVEILTDARLDENVRWNSVGEFLDTLERQGIVMNMALLVPHALLRLDQVGSERRRAAPDEVRAMSCALEAALEEGAIGMSAGLQYFPGSCSDTGELSALGAGVKKYDGIFACHLRSYCKTLPLAIDEVMQVARRNQIRAQVSHIFHVPEFGPVLGPVVRKFARAMAGLSEWWTLPVSLGRSLDERLDQVFDAASGIEMGADVMPTNTGFTYLLAFLPPWVVTGTRAEIVARLKDREARKRILASIKNGDLKWPHEGDSWSLNNIKLMGWECLRVMAVVSEKNRQYEGMRLVDVAAHQNKHPLDALCDLLVEENGHVLVFISIAQPDDSFTEQAFYPAFAHPRVSICTDTLLFGIGKPSNLFYGCYPRFLGRHVREKRLLPLETAVRKITGLPAEHFRLKYRGRIREGYYADLVVFDPKTVGSPATFSKPDVGPVGIEHVFVNGRHVVNGEKYAGETRPGRVLRRG